MNKESLSIDEFYEQNILDDNFDEVVYAKLFPETLDFYQPYCKDNNIGDKKRLYYHYYFFGKENYTYHDDDHALLIKTILATKETLYTTDNTIAVFAKAIINRLLIKILKLFRDNIGLRICKYPKQRADTLNMVEFLTDVNVFSPVMAETTFCDLEDDIL